MTGGTHSQGAFAQLLIEPGSAPHTFDSSSIIMEFLAENIGFNRRIIGGQGIRGTLSRPKERTREGARPIRGEIISYIDPNLIDALADDVWGMTESPAGTFTVDDDLPYFGILIDRDQGVFEYQDCKLDYVIIESGAYRMGDRAEPDMFILRQGIIASTEVGPNDGSPPSWPGTPPTLGTAAADAPYIFSDTDSGITLFGSARAIQQMRLEWRNFLLPKFVNSLEAHSIRPTNRIVRAQFQLPWNSTNEDLHDTDVAGAAASFVMTNGNLSSTFSTWLEADSLQTPVVRGKREVGFFVSGMGVQSGSTKELIIVNDNTP